MRFKITEPTQRDLAELEKKTQRRIKAVLDRLLSYPLNPKKLKGSREM